MDTIADEVVTGTTELVIKKSIAIVLQVKFQG